MPKILIVDDEEKALSYYSDILSCEGYTVVTAGSGKDGLSTAKRELR